MRNNKRPERGHEITKISRECIISSRVLSVNKFLLSVDLLCSTAQSRCSPGKSVSVTWRRSWRARHSKQYQSRRWKIPPHLHTSHFIRHFETKNSSRVSGLRQLNDCFGGEDLRHHSNWCESHWISNSPINWSSLLAQLSVDVFLMTWTFHWSTSLELMLLPARINDAVTNSEWHLRLPHEFDRNAFDQIKCHE